MEDTGSHKLLHTAAREGRILWPYEVQIEPVCHLYRYRARAIDSMVQ